MPHSDSTSGAPRRLWPVRIYRLGEEPGDDLVRAALIDNKRAAGRRKDLADLEAMGELPPA